MKTTQSPPVAEPTAEEIERVAVVLVQHELRIAGVPEFMIQAADVHGRAEAVAHYGEFSRLAIMTVRAMPAVNQTPFSDRPQSPQETGL